MGGKGREQLNKNGFIVCCIVFVLRYKTRGVVFNIVNINLFFIKTSFIFTSFLTPNPCEFICQVKRSLKLAK